MAETSLNGGLLAKFPTEEAFAVALERVDLDELFTIDKLNDQFVTVKVARRHVLFNLENHHGAIKGKLEYADFMQRIYPRLREFVSEVCFWTIV
jgi:hypothetical protein